MFAFRTSLKMVVVSPEAEIKQKDVDWCCHTSSTFLAMSWLFAGIPLLTGGVSR